MIVMRTLRSYGVPVYVTELDMDMSSLGGTQESRILRQAAMYKIVTDAMLASGVCRSISFWGAVDGFSFPESLGHQNAEPLLFDRNLNHKPAYYAVSSVLLEYLRSTRQTSP
ncbi:endo-1,4-beta-xylanase [Chloroflexus aggregans]|uniref:endo-1,4-beta-xylanase n=1 Tax=Chloroflexus aggregans TaxID=152260 RepID=UPI000A0555BE